MPENNAIETPKTAAASAQEGEVAAGAAGGRRFVPAGLLGIGIVLGVVGLFPAYVGEASLASQSFNAVAHAGYLVAWAIGTVLIILGGTRMRAGALLGAGTSAVTFGLFLADIGTAVSGGASVGAGLVLSLVGWLCCTAGAVLAVKRGPAVLLSWPRGDVVAPLVTLMLAALGVAIAFAPSWDRFELRSPAGIVQSVTAGYAFANPAMVIAGNVATMIAFVAVVVVAALWRPIQAGAALAVGAIVPLVAQAISALVQVGQGATPAQFGVSPSQAAQDGLTASASVTLAFWVFCAFLVAAILVCTWMATAGDDEAGQTQIPVTN